MSANQHLIYDPLTIKDTSTGGGPLGGTGSRPRQVCTKMGVLIGLNSIEFKERH